MIRDMNRIENDIIRKKRILRRMLCEDADIIEALDNHDLDPECPEEYLGVNIFSFIRIPDVQDTAQSYITFMLDDVEASPSNKSMKTQYLKFVVFVHKDLVETKWGIDRHDLLAALIVDILHQSNALGGHCTLISNTENATDTDFCMRTLQFEMTVPNSQPFKTNKYEKSSIVDKQDRVVQRESIR